MSKKALTVCDAPDCREFLEPGYQDEFWLTATVKPLGGPAVGQGRVSIVDACCFEHLMAALQATMFATEASA